MFLQIDILRLFKTINEKATPIDKNLKWKFKIMKFHLKYIGLPPF